MALLRASLAVFLVHLSVVLSGPTFVKLHRDGGSAESFETLRPNEKPTTLGIFQRDALVA